MRPEMFMAKLDMKDAYYSIPILGSHQKHLKFNYNHELYKNTFLPNGYTKVPIKLPLSDWNFCLPGKEISYQLAILMI